jgi:hypothetical protein
VAPQGAARKRAVMDLAKVAAVRAALWQFRYRPVPLLSFDDPDRARAGKAPLHKDWPIRARLDPPEAAVTPAQAHLSNTGVLADGLRVLDVDVDHFGRADAIEELAIRLLGGAPTRRRSNSNRFAMLYRAAEGCPGKRVLRGRTGDPKHPDKIEVLGKGQQFVAYGWHVTGVEVYWTGREPLDMKFDELPSVTEDQIAGFLDEAAGIVEAPGSARRTHGSEQSHGSNGTTDSGALTTLASALKALPAAMADDYASWILVGCALYHATAGQLAGRELWEDWSRQSTKYIASEIKTRWASFDSATGDRAAAGTIFRLAAQHGWTFPQPEPPEAWEKHHPAATGFADSQADDHKVHRPGRQPPVGWHEPVDCFAVLSADPVDAMEEEAPPALWPFIKDVAERMGVATSSVMLGALVACAAVISDEWRLQPRRHDHTWVENARLWAAIVGPPSTLKTPVIAVCTRPVDYLESEGRKQWQEEQRRHVEQHAAWQKARSTGKASGAECGHPEPSPPKRSRWLVESFTIEALQEVLRDDANARFIAPSKKILVRQDELSELLANLDRYSAGRSGGDRGALLRLYNGGPFSVDRIGRGSFTANHWSGCLVGGIQPEPIQRIAQQTVDDGLLQRMIFDVPHTQRRDAIDRVPDRGALDRYGRLIPALAALHPATSGERAAGNIVLHAGAHIYRENISELAGTMAAVPDISGRLQSAFGKWPGLFARLCLTFHLIEIADARAAGDIGPPLLVVSATTAERVARYMRRVLLPHALRADAMMFATAQTNHAEWIAGHILAHRLDRITTRDVVRAYHALRAPEAREELRNVMASLVSIDWLDPEPPRNPLNPISAWRVNPLVHELFAVRAEMERQQRERRAAEVRARRQAHAT